MVTVRKLSRLSRTRFVRFTPEQDAGLVGEARKQKCTVSDLLRTAAIEAFSLPANGNFSTGGAADNGVTGYEDGNAPEQEMQDRG